MACDLIIDILKAIRESNAELHVILIPSEMNPADEPSRGKEVCWEKMVPFQAIFSRGFVEVPIRVKSLKITLEDGSLRHEDEENEMFQTVQFVM